MVWQVAGTYKGRRIQQTRTDQVEAEKIATEHNAMVMRQQTFERPAMTKLSADRLRDAERAVELLPEWASLFEAAQFFNQHFRPVTARPLSDTRDGTGKATERGMISTYLDRLRHESKNETITVHTLKFILQAFAREARLRTTVDITTERTRAWVFEKGLSDRTHRDRYDHVKRFCRWLTGERALFADPLADVARPTVKTEPPAIFTVPRIQKLLNTAWTDPGGPQMVPFFATCVMSGVRPFEYRRAEDQHFFLDDGHPIFEVWEAKTPTAPWRTVELSEPLVRILKGCRKRGLNLAFWSERQFDRIRRDAGVFEDWDNDILRHCYASYTYASEHDMRTLEANMGNSEKVLLRHYIRRSVRHSEAEAFQRLRIDWKLRPRQADALIAC